MKSIPHISVGTRALIASKLYYGVLTKSLEHLDVDRYFAVLFYIHENKECCCQQKICDDLLIDKTAMVKVLDHLSSLDFIEKRVNPKDRREHVIYLSKKGEKQTREIIKAMSTLDHSIFTGVSETDQNTFLRVLGLVIHNLQQMPSNNLFFNYKSPKKQKPVKP